MKPVAGQVWIYKQSLRPYVVLEVKNGEVEYTTPVMSPAFGNRYKRSITKFMNDFVPQGEITDQDVLNAVNHTLKHYGLGEASNVTVF